MPQKVLIIANLKAGKANMNQIIHKIEKNLQKLNMQTSTQYTSLEESATDILKKYPEEYDILLVCGGDGTLNQAVQVLCKMDKKVPIAYIPTGTTNDFAKSLGLPFDKLEISKNILTYEEKECDVGLFNDRFFNYVVSIGLFSKTSYATSYQTKNRFGRIGYLFLGAKEIFENQSNDLKLISKEMTIEDDFIYGSISNSSYIGGFHLFKKDKMNLADGKFEILFVKKPKYIFHKLKLFFKVLLGNFKDENIYYFQTSHLKIEAKADTEWSIDGEYSGKVKNIEITNCNQKITYFVPKNSK